MTIDPAGKRPASDGSSSSSSHLLPDPDHHHHADAAPPEKRIRPTTRFVTVVQRAWEHNQREQLCSAMEPIIRKVVSEELESRLGRIKATSNRLRRSPSIRVRAPEPLPVNIILHLVFPKTLKQPIFTLNKIVFDDGSPVQVVLVDPRSVDPTMDTAPLVSLLTFPIKLEIVVLEGDFHPLHPDRDGVWTPEEFEGSIMRARVGRRPLLAGELTASLLPDGGSADQLVTSFVELQLTDNSSWTRSRKFRLGVRVIPGSYGGPIRIQEAVTEAFVIRDHRGESYKKHYPPTLEDEVWRLEKIARGGKLNKKLASAGVETVRDLLIMSVFDPQRLRSIMGSEKNREASLQHAMTCEMGCKRYIFQVDGCSLVFDPICRLAGAHINGQKYTVTELSSFFDKTYLDGLVQNAHSNWDQVQEVEE